MSRVEEVETTKKDAETKEMRLALEAKQRALHHEMEMAKLREVGALSNPFSCQRNQCFENCDVQLAAKMTHFLVQLEYYSRHADAHAGRFGWYSM